MKKWIVLASLLSSCAFAQLSWAPSYEAALKQAKNENKKVMVMLSKEGCPACEYMEDIVFEEKMLSDAIHKSFVPVHIDIHEGKVPSGLGFIGTPTFHFLDADGKKLHRHDGGANVPTFLGVIRNVK